MCKLLIATNRGKSENAKKFLAAQFRELETEKDGIGAIAISKNGNRKICRSLDNYDQVFKFVYNELEKNSLVAIHTRTGTSGRKNEKNVHFFSHKNRIFAHNGFVGKYHRNSLLGFDYSLYSQKKEIGYVEASEILVNCPNCNYSQRGYCHNHKYCNDIVENYDPSMAMESREADEKQCDGDDNMCDSFLFMKNLPPKIDKESLNERIERDNFLGAALLIDNKKVYFICKKECYHVEIDNVNFFSTFKMQEKYKVENIVNKNNILVNQTETKNIPVNQNRVVEGIYEVKL